MTTRTGILYLQKDRFHLYSAYLPNILEFRFVPELIRDFDLINKELLENLLKVFIANNKVPASGLIVVVGDNASFIKDFVAPPVNPAQPTTTPPPTLEDLQNLANQYIEQVPFEAVASKTFPLATGVRAYATNQEIYEAIKSILEKQGFIIQGVYPGFAFGQEISAKPALDGSSIGIIMQKLGMLHAYNLLKEDMTIVETTPDTIPGGEEEEKKDIKSLLSGGKMPVLIAIAAIVLILVVTGAILYSQFSASTPQKLPVNPSATGNISVPTPTPVIVSPTVPVTIDVKALTVKITAVSSSAVTAQKINTALAPYGFKSVTTQTQDNLGSSQAILIFASTVTPQVRSVITTEVKKILGEVLVQENQSPAADVVIILGK